MTADSAPAGRWKQLVLILAAISIPWYLFYYAGDGLNGGFTWDDLMNLHKSWLPGYVDLFRDVVLFFRPSDSFRPLGSLFYRVLFDVFGLEAFPYRAACFALLLANLWLAFCVARRLAKSYEIALLTTVLLAYHRDLWPLYVNSGMCYDLLCFFFFTSAFLYYLRAREREFPLGLARLAIFSGLYVLCMDSKEAAVALPVLIGVYELLWNPPHSWRVRELRLWLFREGRVPLIGGVLTLLFIFGRMQAPQGIAHTGGYQVTLDPSAYFASAHFLLRQAFYDPGWFTPLVSISFFLALAAAAILWSSAPLGFSLVWMLVGILPIAFIARRDLAQAYVATFGLALCVAICVAGVARLALERILGARGRRFVSAAGYAPVRSAAALLLGLTAVVLLTESAWTRDLLKRAPEGPRIRSVLRQLRELRPGIREDARILFLGDPFPEEEWASTFLLHLYSRTRNLRIERADRPMRHPETDESRRYDFVFAFERKRLTACDVTVFNGVAHQDAARIPCLPVAAPAAHPPGRLP